MSNPKDRQTDSKPAIPMPKPKKPEARVPNKADPAPDDSIEGEGSPGLTITGGGGHA
jgi:hypothetical protein